MRHLPAGSRPAYDSTRLSAQGHRLSHRRGTPSGVTESTPRHPAILVRFDDKNAGRAGSVPDKLNRFQCPDRHVQRSRPVHSACARGRARNVAATAPSVRKRRSRFTGRFPSIRTVRGDRPPGAGGGPVNVPLIVVIVVLTALAFDFTNGFHDTANAMATSIASGALRPKVAVAIAGVLNVAGAFLSVKVASTISGGIVDEAKFNHVTGPYVVFGALIGAIIWNLITWYLGLPSSSSHALFGGLIGATWIAFGTGAVSFTTVVAKVIIPAVASPL